MKFNSVKLSNFGPIKSGTISNEKITIFYGPNNSGKSMVSKLIHSIWSFESKSYAKITPQLLSGMGKNAEKKITLWHILDSMSLPPSQLITKNAKECTVSIKNRTDTTQIKISPNDIVSPLFRLFRHRVYKRAPTKQSIYMPASRTGTIQFFTNIIQVRSKLLDDLSFALSVFNTRDRRASSEGSKQFLESIGTLPTFMDEFYNMLLEVYTNGVTNEFQEMFQELFAGQIESLGSDVTERLMFKDSQGVSVKVDDAGSGVLSSFPILVGLLYIRKNGNLIIEEPEAHMESERLFRLLDQLCRVSNTRNNRLLLTTHSDLVIQFMLAMVSQGLLKPSELGLYYFNREQTDFTIIEKKSVSKQGESNQTFFEKPLNILIDKFSK